MDRHPASSKALQFSGVELFGIDPLLMFSYFAVQLYQLVEDTGGVVLDTCKAMFNAKIVIIRLVAGVIRSQRTTPLVG